MSPNLLTLAIYAIFSKRYRENGHSERKRFKMAAFPVSRGRKSHISQGVEDPKGPNLEKVQDLEIFKRAWKFQASHPPNPFFCGEFWRSGLKISSEIEIFKRDWKFQAILKFFKIWALRGLGLTNNHPAAKGVRQKEFGKKWRKKRQKRQKKWPKSDRKCPEKREKSDRTPFAALLLRHPHQLVCQIRPSVLKCSDISQSSVVLERFESARFTSPVAFQQLPRVTSIGSLPPKSLRKRTPAEPRRTLGETPAEPSERPPQRFSAAAAAIFTAPPKIARFFEAPRCAISSAKKIASEPRFLLRRKWVKMVLAGDFPQAAIYIPSSAIKIASELRCAILVHSASERQISSENLAEGCAPRMVTLRTLEGLRLWVLRYEDMPAFAGDKEKLYTDIRTETDKLKTLVDAKPHNLEKEADYFCNKVKPQMATIRALVDKAEGVMSLVRAARLQNEPAPEKQLNRHGKWFEDVFSTS